MNLPFQSFKFHIKLLSNPFVGGNLLKVQCVSWHSNTHPHFFQLLVYFEKALYKFVQKLVDALPTFSHKTINVWLLPRCCFPTESSLGLSHWTPLQLSTASLIVSGHCADLTKATWLLLPFNINEISSGVHVTSPQWLPQHVWPLASVVRGNICAGDKRACSGYRLRALHMCVCVCVGCQMCPCVSSWNINRSK